MKKPFLEPALKALCEGQTLLYPTDTIWGVGCDATNAQAVEKIYAIKERDHTKSMLVLASPAMLSPLLPTEAADLLLRSQRPTTVILPQNMLLAPLAENLPAHDGTVGVRIPNMDFCQQLLSAFGKPIVSTSANLSGHPSPASYEDIDPEILHRIDCPLPDHPDFHHPSTGSSTIVKLTPTGIITIRP